MSNRLFWSCWLLATGLTGIVAGFMLGHVLILGRFLDWMLDAGRPGLLTETYPVFRASAGRVGLQAFYGIAALQVLAACAFGAVAFATRRHRVLASLGTAAGAAWVVVHYASGFATVEATVLQGAAVPAVETVRRFLAWNQPLHAFHVTSLAVSLIALLAVPLVALRRR